MASKSESNNSNNEYQPSFMINGGGNVDESSLSFFHDQESTTQSQSNATTNANVSQGSTNSYGSSLTLSSTLNRGLRDEKAASNLSAFSYAAPTISPATSIMQMSLEDKKAGCQPKPAANLNSLSFSNTPPSSSNNQMSVVRPMYPMADQRYPPMNFVPMHPAHMLPHPNMMMQPQRLFPDGFNNNLSNPMGFSHINGPGGMPLDISLRPLMHNNPAGPMWNMAAPYPHQNLPPLPMIIPKTENLEPHQSATEHGYWTSHQQSQQYPSSMTASATMAVSQMDVKPGKEIKGIKLRKTSANHVMTRIGNGKRKLLVNYEPDLESKSKKHRMVYPKGTFLIRLSDLATSECGQWLWLVDNHQLLQKFVLNRVDESGCRLYSKTERYSGWLCEEGWLYYPLSDVVLSVEDDPNQLWDAMLPFLPSPEAMERHKERFVNERVIKTERMMSASAEGLSGSGSHEGDGDSRDAYNMNTGQNEVEGERNTTTTSTSDSQED